MSYKKILLAIDLNKSNAHLGLTKAFELATSLSATLYITYVTSFGEKNIDDSLYFGDTVENEITQLEKNKLNELILRALDGLEFPKENIYIINGPIDLAVEKLANKLDIELIIIMKSHHHFNIFSNNESKIDNQNQFDILIFR